MHYTAAAAAAVPFGTSQPLATLNLNLNLNLVIWNH